MLSTSVQCTQLGLPLDEVDEEAVALVKQQLPNVTWPAAPQAPICYSLRHPLGTRFLLSLDATALFILCYDHHLLASMDMYGGCNRRSPLTVAAREHVCLSDQQRPQRPMDRARARGVRIPRTGSKMLSGVGFCHRQTVVRSACVCVAG